MYFVAENGQRQGPFGYAQLQEMAMAGTLQQSTMVWTAGMASWQAAGTVQALAQIFAMVPPPMP